MMVARQTPQSADLIKYLSGFSSFLWNEYIYNACFYDHRMYGWLDNTIIIIRLISMNFFFTVIAIFMWNWIVKKSHKSLFCVKYDFGCLLFCGPHWKNHDYRSVLSILSCKPAPNQFYINEKKKKYGKPHANTRSVMCSVVGIENQRRQDKYL